MGNTKKVIIAIQGSTIETFNSVPAVAKFTGVSVSAIFKADIKGPGATIKKWLIMERPIRRLKDKIDEESAQL